MTEKPELFIGIFQKEPILSYVWPNRLPFSNSVIGELNNCQFKTILNVENIQKLHIM
jgi:hypothetical protein